MLTSGRVASTSAAGRLLHLRRFTSLPPVARSERVYTQSVMGVTVAFEFVPLAAANSLLTVVRRASDMLSVVGNPGHRGEIIPYRTANRPCLSPAHTTPIATTSRCVHDAEDSAHGTEISQDQQPA
ncbi:Uncharacterised protein [Mycobacteroides abscessus subsp. abscessus]|nr:Uncharacterised protein [Mycobacteroides abscessus subsp. abscessus]